VQIRLISKLNTSVPKASLQRTQLALGNSGVTFETMVNTIATNKATRPSDRIKQQRREGFLLKTVLLVT
jgi:hypothetical protein